MYGSAGFSVLPGTVHFGKMYWSVGFRVFASIHKVSCGSCHCGQGHGKCNSFGSNLVSSCVTAEYTTSSSHQKGSPATHTITVRLMPFPFGSKNISTSGDSNSRSRRYRVPDSSVVMYNLQSRSNAQALRHSESRDNQESPQFECMISTAKVISRR